MPTFAGGGRGQHKERQTKFTNSVTQVRPGLGDAVRALENLKDEEWTEEQFKARAGDDRTWPQTDQRGIL
eukprot:6515137-Alexandrium_andersonii.AAC.1